MRPSSTARRSSAASVLLGGAGVTSAALAADARSVKDGVFIGPISPLNTIVAASIDVPRVNTFLRAIEKICQSHATTTAANRPQWYQHEFRAACEAAVPVAADLSSRALFDAAATPITVHEFLDAVSCHVSMTTKESLQKLQFTARMVGRRHAAPSSRGATAGTPTSMAARPSAAAAAGGSAASLAAGGGGGRAIPPFPAAELPAGGPGAVAGGSAASPNGLGSKRDRGGADDSGEGRQQAPPQPVKAEKREDGSLVVASNTTHATNAAAARPITADKLNVIMPWTIPAPHQDGVVLRRVRPRTFKPSSSSSSGAGKGDEGAGGSTPTVQAIVSAAATPQVFEMWAKREAALVKLGGACAGSAAAAAAETSKDGSARLPPPGPIFPHVAAHRGGGGGLAGPSGIGDDALLLVGGATSATRHTTVRKSFLTALAHYGVHWVKRGSVAANAASAVAVE